MVSVTEGKETTWMRKVMTKKSPFWKHSQCEGCIHVQINKKAGRISCPHHPDGISLEVERWDTLCEHRSLGEGVWIDDTHLFAMCEKFGERADRFGDTDLRYVELEEKKAKRSKK